MCNHIIFEFSFINSRYYIIVEFDDWKEFKFIDINGLSSLFYFLHLFQSNHYSVLDSVSSKYNVSARVIRKEMLFGNSYNIC